MVGTTTEGEMDDKTELHEKEEIICINNADL